MAVLTALDHQFPALSALRGAQKSYVWRKIRTLVEAGWIEESLATLGEANDLLRSKDEEMRLGAYIFDSGAKVRMKAGAWAEAADIYARGLKQLPESDLLRTNVVYLAQEWAKQASTEGFNKGLAVLVEFNRQFPTIKAMTDVQEAYVQRQVKALVEAGRIDDALTTIEETGDLFISKDETLRLGAYVFDSAGKMRMKAGAWTEAADIYVRGLKRLPKSDLLQNNIAYLAQEWARAALARGGVAAVIRVAEQVVVLFPSLPRVGEGPLAVIAGVIDERVRAGEFEAAVALVGEASKILPADQVRNLYEFSFDRWVKSFMGKKQWNEAVKIYDQGLDRLPTSNLFKQNKMYCLAQLR